LQENNHPIYDAALIMCVDGAWITRSLHEITQHLGHKCDVHTIPGAAKDFHEEGGEFAHSLIDNIVRVSMGLHRVPKIVLLSHWNCGAYGGSKTLLSLEESTYTQDLLRAKKFISQEIERRASLLLSNADISDEMKEGIKSYDGEMPMTICFSWQPSRLGTGHQIVEV
jgi:hypothetical protein